MRRFLCAIVLLVVVASVAEAGPFARFFSRRSASASSCGAQATTASACGSGAQTATGCGAASTVTLTRDVATGTPSTITIDGVAYNLIPVVKK